MNLHSVRAAVLLSGQGTTFQALWEAADAGQIPIAIVRVVSNRASAFGLVRAANLGVPTYLTRGTTDESRSQELFEILRADQVELVLCAGWLKKLILPADFEGKVLNVHPSLLPDFGGPGMYGRAVHEAVLAAGCSESGCTIHYVNAEYDQGPILWQQRVNIEDCTTAEAIQARVTAAEKIAYPEAIRRHFSR